MPETNKGKRLLSSRKSEAEQILKERANVSERQKNPKG